MLGERFVPLCGWLDEPLDLSYSVLRSVSPIHVEYLQNMGVGASMSVSIIVDGRLWGMIACHHMAVRQDMLRVIERHAPALLNSLGGEVLTRRSSAKSGRSASLRPIWPAKLPAPCSTNNSRWFSG